MSNPNDPIGLRYVVLETKLLRLIKETLELSQKNFDAGINTSDHGIASVYIGRGALYGEMAAKIDAVLKEAK